MIKRGTANHQPNRAIVEIRATNQKRGQRTMPMDRARKSSGQSKVQTSSSPMYEALHAHAPGDCGQSAPTL